MNFKATNICRTICKISFVCSHIRRRFISIYVYRAVEMTENIYSLFSLNSIQSHTKYADNTHRK